MFNKRPWVIIECSNGSNGPQTTIYQRRLMSGIDATATAHRLNQVSPYGRAYVAYHWKVRPATPKEIESLSAYED